jgi:hypothetical protein
MHFMGAKGMWAKKIVAEIEPWRVSGSTLVEIGFGACNLTEHWQKPIIAVDANPVLHSLWTAAQSGWVPPPRNEINEELHLKYRKSPIDPKDPMTGFLLFGCSFRGVWRGGFANTVHLHDRGKPRTIDLVANSRKAFIRKAQNVAQGVEFVLGSYSDITPSSGQVVYADIPYKGTCADGIAETRKATVGPFDHANFWDHVRKWTAIGARVFVSEETAPDDFIRYRSWQVKRALGNSSAEMKKNYLRLESIWVHRDSDMVARVRRSKPRGDVVASSGA